MALRLVADFDPQRDVLPELLAQRGAPAAGGARGGGADILLNYDSLRVQNFERNGDIIYTYKDDKGNVYFGLYDCQIRQNKHLYTFETDLEVLSSSVNSERTLLAVSLVQTTKKGRRNKLQPDSKCLTLLVEIHPVNNVKVLKAVDSCIWVQFLYPHVESHPLSESHLLLVSEEKYIEQFHIQVIQEDENKVVIKNSGHLSRDRVAEDFIWAQWDTLEQRLYYIELKKSKSILKCIQFNADENFTIMFEAPLDISLTDFGFKLVNFGCDYLQDQETFSKHPSLCVFTNKTGSLCVCYSPKFDSWEKITYSVFYFHKGHSKTFTTKLGSADSRVTRGITFLSLDYYLAVYLPGHFFHLLNIQHPDLVCHSLFLTGNSEVIDVLPHSPALSLSGSLVLDWSSGKLYKALLNQLYLLQFLWKTPLDCERVAVLHCLLAHSQDSRFLEAQVGTGLKLQSGQLSKARCIHLVGGRDQKLFLLGNNCGLWSLSVLKPILFLFRESLLDSKLGGHVCPFEHSLLCPVNKYLAMSVVLQRSAQKIRSFPSILLFLLVCSQRLSFRELQCAADLYYLCSYRQLVFVPPVTVYKAI